MPARNRGLTVGGICALAATSGAGLHRRFVGRTVEAGLILVAAFAVVGLGRRRRPCGPSLPPPLRQAMHRSSACCESSGNHIES
jgi:hypothetical protein